jgi:hypothetical protein
MTGGQPQRPAWRPNVGLALLALGMLIWPSTGATIALIGAAIGVTIARAALGARRRARPPAPAAGTAGAVALGVDRRGDPVLLSDLQLSAHGLVLGASGAGKSTTLLTILGDHVRRGRAVVALDMKGSPAFAGELERAARCGTAVPVLDARRP